MLLGRSALKKLIIRDEIDASFTRYSIPVSFGKLPFNLSQYNSVLFKHYMHAINTHEKKRDYF